MAIVLGALCLLGLGMFGPGIASGIVSGGPQLGAGTAAGTALTAGAVVAAGGAATMGAIGAAGGALAGAGRAVGSAANDYRTGGGNMPGGPGASGGHGQAGRGGVGDPPSPLRRSAATGSEDVSSGGSAQRQQVAAGARQASGSSSDRVPSAGAGTGSGEAENNPAPLHPAVDGNASSDGAAGTFAEAHPIASGTPSAAEEGGAEEGTAAPRGQPEWAAAMRRKQTIGHGIGVAAHTLRAGDSQGSGTSVSVTDKE